MGVGFGGMRERARELGGLLSVRRAEDGGTVVSVEIPIVARRSQDEESGGTISSEAAS